MHPTLPPRSLSAGAACRAAPHPPRCAASSGGAGGSDLGQHGQRGGRAGSLRHCIRPAVVVWLLAQRAHDQLLHRAAGTQRGTVAGQLAALAPEVGGRRAGAAPGVGLGGRGGRASRTSIGAGQHAAELMAGPVARRPAAPHSRARARAHPCQQAQQLGRVVEPLCQLAAQAAHRQVGGQLQLLLGGALALHRDGGGARRRGRRSDGRMLVGAGGMLVGAGGAGARDGRRRHSCGAAPRPVPAHLSAAARLQQARPHLRGWQLHAEPQRHAFPAGSVRSGCRQATVLQRGRGRGQEHAGWVRRAGRLAAREPALLCGRPAADCWPPRMQAAHPWASRARTPLPPTRHQSTSWVR